MRRSSPCQLACQALLAVSSIASWVLGVNAGDPNATLMDMGRSLFADDPFNGYYCDMAMESCTVGCEPAVNLLLPNTADCETWGCVMRCAKVFEHLGCLQAWSAVCAHYKEQPAPMGIGGQQCGVEVDCSAAGRGASGLSLLCAAALLLVAVRGAEPPQQARPRRTSLRQRRPHERRPLPALLHLSAATLAAALLGSLISPVAASSAAGVQNAPSLDEPVLLGTPKWDDFNGYECDQEMEECVGNCPCPLSLESPDDIFSNSSATNCVSWKCIMGCASRHADLGCLEPWQRVCRAYKDLPPPFGPRGNDAEPCDLDCSFAARLPALLPVLLSLPFALRSAWLRA
eukprot:TRINITY_DN26638_c0_g1_i1.p2 TRINITY_DN26638_c0_g1~~TRINITY_DN26638_c0_g1_i1.p2  ORF type:complete len:368 (+),score=62.82 TRINITY_DN26638_c0_g1_i1:73-1104(+)